MSPTQPYDILDRHDLERALKEREEAGLNFGDKIAQAAKEAAQAGMDTAEWMRQETERVLVPVQTTAAATADPNDFIRTITLGYVLGAVTVAAAMVLSRLL